MPNASRPGGFEPNPPRMAIRIGCVAVPAALLVAQVPQQLNGGQLFIGVVMVLAMLPLAAIGFGASPRTWVAVIGLAMMIMVPITGLALVDVPLAGPTVTGPVSGAADHPWAAGYRFTDATARLDLAGSRTITTRGGRSTSSSTYTVVPVVPPDWVPARPVQVWIVLDGDGPPAAGLSGPNLSAARLLGWSDPDRAQAVRDVARRDHLVAAPRLLLVRPVHDPSAVWWLAWLKLAAIDVAFTGAWILLVLLGRPR